MENFDHIELTEEETKEALRLYREKKHDQIEQQKYSDGIRAMRQTKKFTAEEFYKAFTQIFPIDERKENDYAVIVKRLCCYFSGDKRFEIGDLKLAKGILLFGGVGVGKTTLMQMFKQNQAFSYRVISCRDIESQFGQEGPVALEKYGVNFPIATNSNPFGATEIGYCFDDLGTENSVTKHYGNAKTVMTDIILNRYDNKLDFRATHITTNLSAEEIEQHYGTRVIDRIREMFNLIAFPDKAKSRR